MFGTIAEPRAIRLDAYSAAFERKLLPNFAEWMLDQIELWKPDFLIPIETRGVHVLDASLTYAREHLGRIIDTPILYRSALAYQPRDVLERSRLLIVEDAIDTGASLQGYLDEISLYGATNTRAIACFGSDRKRDLLDVDCFLLAEQKRYMQYLWQLIEVVVSRGLPPEVDHAIYEMRLPTRLTQAWDELQSLLSRYGTLTIDGPESKRDEMQPMTLHFPRLDSTPPGAFSSGPNKVRFFPDPAGDRVFVLPIAFPVLQLPPMSVTGQLDLAAAETILSEALGVESEIGKTLLERAHLLDPLTIFRAASTAREVAIVTGVARTVGEVFSGTTVSSYDNVFGRLFGRTVGDELSAMVKRQVDAAANVNAPALKTVDPASEPTYLDGTVAEATRALAEHLRDRSRNDGGGPTHRAAVSLIGLKEVLTNDPGRLGSDLLLASRCASHGLAVATLVPIIDRTYTDQMLTVERKYRVSEPFVNRDLEMVRIDKSAQAIAVICNRLQFHMEHYGKGIPKPVLACFIALLRTLVLEPHELTLEVRPDVRADVLIVLCAMVTPHSIDAPSTYYLIDDKDRVRPTKRFMRDYGSESLDLDVTDSTLAIEREIDMLMRLLDEGGTPDELDGRMRLWTLTSDHALGMAHVRASLLAALNKIQLRLNAVASEEEHKPNPGLVEEVSDFTRDARKKAERLRSSVRGADPIRPNGAPGRQEKRLVGVLGVATEVSPMYELSGALIEIIEATAHVAHFLDAVSDAGWRGEDMNDLAAFGYAGVETDVTRASLAALVSADLAKEALKTLNPNRQPLPTVAADERVALAHAASVTLELIEQIAMFTAALAGVFRCPRLGDPMFRSSPEPPSGRDATVMLMDIEGYRKRSETTDAISLSDWTMRGFDLVSQWARVFGGVERPEIRGDEILMAFGSSGDSAVLAAASVLCHTVALRSMGIPALSWRFHHGIDHGHIEVHENILIGACVNNAASFAKRGETSDTEVKFTTDAQKECSPELLALTSLRDLGLLQVSKEADDDTARVRVMAIDAVEVIGALTKRLQSVAHEIKGTFAAKSPLRDPLEWQAEPSDQHGEAPNPEAEAAGGDT